MRELISNTEADTFALGRRLGELAEPGTVVALIGDLGAGKTVFARGVGEGLQITTRVQSPTFILVQAHRGGRLPFHHADLYRLSGEDELEQLGFDEIIEGDGLVLIEWADQFPEALPGDHLRITLSHLDPGRAITIEGTGPQSQRLERVLG